MIYPANFLADLCVDVERIFQRLPSISRISLQADICKLLDIFIQVVSRWSHDWVRDKWH